MSRGSTAARPPPSTSIYYGAGALGAYLPGLAWQEWGWGGSRPTGLVALLLAAAALAAAGERRMRIRLRRAAVV